MKKKMFFKGQIDILSCTFFLDDVSLPADQPDSSPGSRSLSDIECKQGGAKKKKLKRIQKFRKVWCTYPNLRDWLVPVSTQPTKAKCKLCNLIIRAELHILVRHGRSEHHILNRQSSASRSTSIENFIQLQPMSVDERVLEAEIRLVGHLICHNNSLRNINHLAAVTKNIFHQDPISEKIQVKRTKATGIAVNVIGEMHKRDLVQKLKTSQFSIITDESTDISNIKNSCVVVRFYDKDLGKVESKFYELIKIFDKDMNIEEGATGKNLYEGIIGSLEKREIPLSNVIGFAADGCSVMMGENNSVSSRMRKNLPGITVVKCVCHSSHLVSSEACKALPKECENLARDIYSFFKNSSKRICDFEKFQEFVNPENDPLKVLHPSQTRWLSLFSVVERILQLWDSLTLYFRDRVVHLRSVNADHIYYLLNDPFMKLFYEFLEWVLPKFTTFNRFFQSNTVVVTELHERTRDLYKEILLSYLQRDYVLRNDLNDVDPNTKDNFLRNDQMYLGIKVERGLNKEEIRANLAKREDFFKKCRNFLQVRLKNIFNYCTSTDFILSKLKNMFYFLF